MLRFSGQRTVLKSLGTLLIVAALLKSHEILTIPSLDGDHSFSHYFGILHIELELALGIWLVSTVLRRLAWLAATICFAMFCGVTLHRACSGASSCGCFGTVHVNPWITLTLIDIPALGTLIAVRPKYIVLTVRRYLIRVSLVAIRFWQVFRPALRSCPPEGLLARLALALKRLLLARSRRKFVVTASIVVVVLTATVPLLVLIKPAKSTHAYVVLEPKTWIGQNLPILGNVDVADLLVSGRWLVVLHHRDCPDCRAAMPEYKRLARELAGSEDIVRVALIEVPPYKAEEPPRDAIWTAGRLDGSKRWLVRTPVALTVVNGEVRSVVENGIPDLPTVLSDLM